VFPALQSSENRDLFGGMRQYSAVNFPTPTDSCAGLCEPSIDFWKSVKSLTFFKSVPVPLLEKPPSWHRTFFLIRAQRVTM
jgi:hypothetical protein